MKHKAILSALIMVTSLFSLPGLADTATPQPGVTPQRGGTLNFLAEPEPPVLTSLVSTSGAVMKVNAKVIEGLLDYDFNMNPVPQLATSWSVSPDGKDFTSADVAFSILTVKQYNSRGKGTFANVTEVKTPDPYTAIIELSQPAPYLLSAFSANEAPMVPKHLYEGTNILSNPHNTAPIGTGPFVFKEWVRGSHILYERNPNYWDQPKPYIDRLVVKIIPDAATRTIALETGALDLGSDTPIPMSEIERIKKNPKLGIETRGYGYSPTQTRIEFNLDNPYLKNLKVRQAIAHSINLDVLKKVVWYGYASNSPTGITPELTQFHDSTPSPYNFDIAKANKLLDEAGFPRQANGICFQLVHDFMPYGDSFKRVAEYLKSALAKVDIDVTIRSQDFATFVKRVYTDRDFDFNNGSISNLFDPAVGVQRLYWSKTYSPGVPFGNGSHYSNPEVDRLLEQAAVETDPAKRVELYKQFQRIIATEIPDLNLLQINRLTIYNKHVHGFINGIQGVNGSLADVWIEQ
ncbi:ABC transporter substrate-binding protein [Candidatus Symbiopectobacterium sp. 'North America']|uniref:ABC transporter substrate-binding protein n=1 Tax=Candidatus Symbiopectobacterium sp. 'North America' TaxID=2794574 RepID=UPI0018C94496|nr:ABC transporter substrate-binding protein [Candidatus Symbiopectobacterium sp. 'North America']MBG6244064.1 ABC transporter substrate-binding protein [Candidatus Symbiopectobacterium sp. 'North America']